MILFRTTAQLAAYFAERPGLSSLELVDSPIDRLPPFPATLKLVRIEGCPVLTEIPTLPEGLRDLLVYNCPALMKISRTPSTLEAMSVHDCPGVTSLPALNDGLVLLDVQGLSIEELPAVPKTVLDLRVCGCRVPVDLPEALQYLEIDSKRVDLGHMINLRGRRQPEDSGTARNES